MTLGRNGSNDAMKTSCRKGGKEAESDDGWCLEAAVCKVRVGWLDNLVQVGDTLMELGADTAYEPITKWRHLPEQNRWAWLDESIGLRNRCKSNVSLHQSERLMSLSE